MFAFSSENGNCFAAETVRQAAELYNLELGDRSLVKVVVGGYENVPLGLLCTTQDNSEARKLAF